MGSLWPLWTLQLPELIPLALQSPVWAEPLPAAPLLTEEPLQLKSASQALLC